MSDLPEVTDPERLRAVEATRLVDSPPEADFDRLAQIAARLLGAPAAFVTVIDRDRQYLKSAVENGAVTDAAGTSTELDRSFCKHTVATNEPFVVVDAREHPLVKDNKAIEDGVIAYAGVPFETSDGHPIGALCVVDSKPREWGDEDIENLRSIGRAASKLLAERESVSASATADKDRHDEIDLAASVAKYLRAERAYSQLLGRSQKLDMQVEAKARHELVQCMAAMRSAHERGLNGRGSQAELLQCVGQYIEAERRRETLAGEFAARTADLASLEAAIARQMDAADALRICALDYGIGE